MPKFVCGMVSRLLMKRASQPTSSRACYIAMPLYLCGFLVLGAAFQKKLSVGAVVMGWGLAEVAVMINTVAVCE